MSTGTLSITSLLRIVPQLPASISVMIRGNHGIGKSQVARQIAWLVAQRLGLTDYAFIDRRLSQQSEGDLIGLPSTDGAVTRFNPPDWYKQACDKPCFLFLDELNRATPEVMQAAFQIVLDRELNGWKLHPQTRVMTAINSSAAYTINEVDPALLDRFWCIDLHATHQDWVDWGRSIPTPYDTDRSDLPTNVDPVVVDFVAANSNFLDPDKNADPGTVEPSRRSWDRLSMALTRANLIDEPTKPEFYEMSVGFVGLETTIAFVDFAKAADNRITGKELLENFDRVKKKLDKLGSERLNIAIDKVTDYILNLTEKVGGKDVPIKELTKVQGENLKKFMTMLPGELRLACWSKLTVKGTERMELAKSIHVNVVHEILDTFQVPFGAAGLGVVPNIPGIFKDK